MPARIFKNCAISPTKKRIKRVLDELKLAGTVALDACKEVVVAGCDILPKDTVNNHFTVSSWSGNRLGSRKAR